MILRATLWWSQWAALRYSWTALDSTTGSSKKAAAVVEVVHIGEASCAWGTVLSMSDQLTTSSLKFIRRCLIHGLEFLIN